MTNMDLFDFNFVDRTIERDETREFIMATEEKRTPVLWISGEKNVGKSFFIENLLKDNNIVNYLYINLDKDNQSLSNSLMLFLNAIDTERLYHYISDHYVNVITLAAKTTAFIVKTISGIDFSDILALISDGNTLFEKKNGVKLDASNLLFEYILEYYKSIPYIIIDQFSSCDESALLIIGNIIIKLIEKTPMRFVLITDSKEFHDYSNLKTLIIQKLSHDRIVIKPMTDYKLFAEILSDIFDFSNIENDVLKYIFNFCDGYPGRLKNLIESLYLNNNIIINNETDRAELRTDNIINLLDDGTYDNLRFDNFLKELIFDIVIISKWTLRNKELINLTSYICQKMFFFSVTNENIICTLREMVSNKLLCDYYKNDELCIGISSDFNYSHLFSIVSGDTKFSQICKYIYEYFEENSWPIENSEKNKAWYSWKASIPNWAEINYTVGESFYLKGDFLSSCDIFLRLQNNFNELSIYQQFIIAKTFYFCGKYTNAFKTLSNNIKMPINSYDYNNLGLEYCLLYAKCLDMIMHKNDAVMFLNMILEYVDENSDDMYSILELKHRILAIIKDGRKESKEIYDLLRKKVKKDSEIYDGLRLTSMEYYRGDLVQNDFKELIEKYHQTNLVLEGECYTNKGFDLFWQGKIEAAKESLLKGLEILENVRIHEISYVLNNLANCYMIEGDFDSAIANLRRASAFNQSPYVDIVIKTNLMVCYAIKNHKSYQKLFKELVKVFDTKEPIDISIVLKVTYALEFVCEVTEYGAAIIDGCPKAIDLANDYEKTVLPYLWFQNWRDDVEADVCHRLPKQQYNIFHSYRFEPWLVTITHD